jgi:hypothetical protein
MADVSPELIEELRTLSEDQQREVLAFTRALKRPRGVPARSLLRFAGSIPADDLEKMARAIEEGCERVDPDEW